MLAKTFKSGNSMALRIPKKLAVFFEGGDVDITQKNNIIILKKINHDWDNIFSSCYQPDFPDFKDLDDFMFSKRASLWLN